MRTFSSYGPIDTDLNYYTSRAALVDRAYRQLIGDDPQKGGHFITVWAPRQTGKTWVMQQVVQQIKAQGDFEVVITTLQGAKDASNIEETLKIFVDLLRNRFDRDFPTITTGTEISTLFTSRYFAKPVILILDEFDALGEAVINQFANAFRTIYTERINENEKASFEKTYLLHGLALIGVRSVLGIENIKGSPFNVQRNLHIPNLTLTEVSGMFDWYSRESGQSIEPEVVTRLFAETRGQPGLIGWLGELLTEQYKLPNDQPMTLAHFDRVYAAALKVLPNNNILNIISKAKQEPYQSEVLDLFKVDQKVPFTFDDPNLSFLYTNGVIDYELIGETDYFVRFASPFVQKRLFNYFANQIFPRLGTLHDPFADLSDAINEQGLNVRNLTRVYEQYLQKNRHWLLKDAPRRETDLRIFEAVYHFNLFTYLVRFLESYGGRVTPEFPTGNGKLDLLIQYAGKRYGLEVKSFVNQPEYQRALRQAAHYGKQLGLAEMSLLLFVEGVDEENRRKYEATYVDATSGVRVEPIFVTTG